MDITREQREERYQKAPPAVQRLYDSEESGKHLFALFQRYQLPEEKYKAYGITVGNVILGFYPFWQLSELLQKDLGIPAEQATGIATDLQPFLAPIAGETVLVRKSAPLPQREMPPPQPDMPPTAPLAPPAWPQARPAAIPQYQKPLTSVPQYRNANLYQKPPQPPK